MYNDLGGGGPPAIVAQSRFILDLFLKFHILVEGRPDNQDWQKKKIIRRER